MKFTEVLSHETKDSLARQRWALTQYTKKPLLTAVVTDKCTLRCDHCFEESGPEKNTFIDSSMIDSLAAESSQVFKGYDNQSLIRITGGDPFLHQDLEKIIRSFSNRKNELNYSSLEVETNGWWAQSDGEAESQIGMVKDSGATILSMSVDALHCKQGKFNVHDNEERIRKAAQKLGLTFRVINSGVLLAEKNDTEEEETVCKNACPRHQCSYLPYITPIGRARSMSEKLWGIQLFGIADGCRLSPPTLADVGSNYVHTDEITVEPDGKVYPCNSGKSFDDATLSIGNIYEKPLTEIMKSQENKTVELIRKGGLRGLSKKIGVPLKEHWETYYKMGPCGLCHEILREHGKELSYKCNK